MIRCCGNYFEAGVVVAVVAVVVVVVVAVPDVVVPVVVVDVVPVSCTTAGASLLAAGASAAGVSFLQPAASPTPMTATRPRDRNFFINLISFFLARSVRSA
jgi:hypothetical protein